MWNQEEMLNVLYAIRSLKLKNMINILRCAEITLQKKSNFPRSLISLERLLSELKLQKIKLYAYNAKLYNLVSITKMSSKKELGKKIEKLIQLMQFIKGLKFLKFKYFKKVNFISNVLKMVKKNYAYSKELIA